MIHGSDQVQHQSIDIVTCGEDRGKGNLLAVQPWLTPADYRSADTLLDALDGYLATGRAAGCVSEKSVVVLPEYLGAWLVVAGEAEAVIRATTMKSAMVALALRHPFAFVRQWLNAREAERATAAIFRLKASAMAAGYHQVASQLAMRYGVHLVAGSIILPEPVIVDGVVTAGEGPLYNVSAVYMPDGSACMPLVRKVFPTSEEQPFVARGRVENLPVFATPAGRLGILICADAWFPECYARMRALHAEIIAVPSYGIHEDFDADWPGYSGYPPPADVDPADIGHLTRSEAWRKYALRGRLASSGAHAGTNVFLHGTFWDSSGSGQTIAVYDADTWACDKESGGALLNLWV